MLCGLSAPAYADGALGFYDALSTIWYIAVSVLIIVGLLVIRALLRWLLPHDHTQQHQAERVASKPDDEPLPPDYIIKH